MYNYSALTTHEPVTLYTCISKAVAKRDIDRFKEVSHVQLQCGSSTTSLCSGWPTSNGPS